LRIGARIDGALSAARFQYGAKHDRAGRGIAGARPWRVERIGRPARTRWLPGARLAALAQDGAADKIISVAHALAGSCASVGAKRMQSIALEIEQRARARAWAELSGELVKLRSAWVVTEAELRAQGFWFE
jgi:hypothetical protein